MCECSQSPPKTVSKLTFDSKMTKNEIERPQMGGTKILIQEEAFWNLNLKHKQKERKNGMVHRA